MPHPPPTVSVDFCHSYHESCFSCEMAPRRECIVRSPPRVALGADVPLCPLFWIRHRCPPVRWTMNGRRVGQGALSVNCRWRRRLLGGTARLQAMTANHRQRRQRRRRRNLCKRSVVRFTAAVLQYSWSRRRRPRTVDQRPLTVDRA